MTTLYAHREDNITTIKDFQGKVKAIYPNLLKQPKRGVKTLNINRFDYSIDWSHVKEKIKKRNYTVLK